MSSQEQKGQTHQLLLEHNLFIVWKPEYNLGIPIIDEQHRGIVTTINSLFFGIQHNYMKEMFVPIIDMMNGYTHIHFQIEEAFLEKIDFAGLEKHKALHRELLLKLSRMGKQSLLDKDPQEFMGFLRTWWTDHIFNEDLTYREHILATVKH